MFSRKLITKICVIYFILISGLFALTCPPSALIKSVHFVTAHPHKYDKELWYLLSSSLIHDNLTWNVSFGMFYSNVTNEEEIFSMGKQFFEMAHLKREKPKPIWITRGVFCDYMPEGSTFFVSALSPPINTP